MLVLRIRFFSILVVLAILPQAAKATPDLKFDVFTFVDNLSQAEFDHLNFPTTNGHYIAMGGDTHRLELATNGNALAIYYNTFNDGYSTNTGAQQAAMIDQYAVSLFTTLGPKPNWVVLNEISTSLWTGDSNYRPWVHDVVHALRTTYGYNVILYSPFPNPGANGADWQAVAADAYIGIENYLSGSLVQSHGFSVSYCQGLYQSSITSYTGLGVPRAKLMLGEEFSHTTTGTSYGRAGVSSNDWDSTIVARNQALQNIGFTGFLSYAWSGNAMGVSSNEMLHFEDTYRTNALPVNSGITAPFIVLQPQSQTIPSGGNAGFTVFKAGIAPTTYQWRFSSTNIAGATGSSLNLTNVQASDAGNYTVALTNSAGTVISSNAFLDVRVPDPFDFEPFAPGGTTYSPGANLIGQTNGAGQRWTQAGPAGVQPLIQSGNLSIGGLQGPSGNSVKFGGNGMSARFNLGTNATSGTWYYSLLVKLTDISTLNSGGVFWAAFNNSAGTQSTTPNSLGTRLLTRSATGGFNVGLDKSSSTTGAFVWAPAVFTTNDTIFIVGSYTFNSATTNDDVSQLWVNPPASTFGLAAAPSATLVSIATNDIPSAVIASFVLFNRSASEPAGIIADEVRVGSSWASVTPPAEVPVAPALYIIRSGSTSVLSWTTNAPGFVLETAPVLADPNAWVPIPSLVYVVGDQYVITNTTASGNNFYRLRNPR